MPKTKTKPEDQYREIVSDSRADTIKELRERVAELESELEAKDQPWKGFGRGTRTGERRILDSAQLRGAAQYLADNNALHATGLIIILIEHFATLAFKKNFGGLDTSIDTFRRLLCREQDGVLEMGLDHLRDDTFKRLSQSINSDAASAIAERAQDLATHNGREYERKLEARDA